MCQFPGFLFPFSNTYTIIVKEGYLKIYYNLLKPLPHNTIIKQKLLSLYVDFQEKESFISHNLSSYIFLHHQASEKLFYSTATQKGHLVSLKAFKFPIDRLSRRNINYFDVERLKRTNLITGNLISFY